MESRIYCLVDASGKVLLKDGAASYADVAAASGVDEDACLKYGFDLADRRLIVDRGVPTEDRAIGPYFDRRVGSPEGLVQFAEAGHVPKGILVNLLDVERRSTYLDACAVLEKQYTDDCAAKGDPCLESGCAVEGEICLEPLLRAGVEYRKACAAEWAKLFADPRNRIESWRH